MPNTKWRHVRSPDNPADLATRGLSPTDLESNRLWWNGPSWLCQADSAWPQLFLQPYDETDIERRPLKANHTAVTPNIETVHSKIFVMVESVTCNFLCNAFFSTEHIHVLKISFLIHLIF